MKARLVTVCDEACCFFQTPMVRYIKQKKGAIIMAEFNKKPIGNRLIHNTFGYIEKTRETREAKEVNAKKTELDRKYEALRAKIKQSDLQARLREVQAERRPEKLIADVTDRMYEEKLTPLAWATGDRFARRAMIERASQIMAEEMRLPDEIRDKLAIQFRWLGEKTNGQTTAFVRESDSGKMEQIVSPEVVINDGLLDGLDSAQPYTTLFHEMLHVLQQVSVLEAVPWDDDVKHWEKNLRGYKGTPKRYVDYLTGPMEAYAHANGELFRKVYKARNFE